MKEVGRVVKEIRRVIKVVGSTIRHAQPPPAKSSLWTFYNSIGKREPSVPMTPSHATIELSIMLLPLLFSDKAPQKEQ